MEEEVWAVIDPAGAFPYDGWPLIMIGRTIIWIPKLTDGGASAGKLIEVNGCAPKFI